MGYCIYWAVLASCYSNSSRTANWKELVSYGCCNLSSGRLLLNLYLGLFIFFHGKETVQMSMCIINHTFLVLLVCYFVKQMKINSHRIPTSLFSASPRGINSYCRPLLLLKILLQWISLQHLWINIIMECGWNDCFSNHSGEYQNSLFCYKEINLIFYLKELQSVRVRDELTSMMKELICSNSSITL